MALPTTCLKDTPHHGTTAAPHPSRARVTDPHAEPTPVPDPTATTNHYSTQIQKLDLTCFGVSVYSSEPVPKLYKDRGTHRMPHALQRHD